MLIIRTQGTWHDMGVQLGDAFADELARCVGRFVGLIQARGSGVAPAVAVVRAAARRYCPELLDELAGMAAGSGLAEEELFRLRFYGDILMEVGCSAFFVSAVDGRAWLGRTCDIEAEDHWQSACQVRCPTGGRATVTTNYLGMIGGIGMNAHGLGIVGVSASTREAYGDAGIFVSMLGHRLLNDCGDLGEAQALALGEPVLGKGAVWLLGDRSGASALYPIVPGRRIEPMPRRAEDRWQACTNFQPCVSIPGKSDVRGRYNAYARYGWLAHQLGGGQAPHTAEGLQAVLRGAAQPGANIPAGVFDLETAYASLFELRAGDVYLAPGNPATVPFERIAFP